MALAVSYPVILYDNVYLLGAPVATTESSSFEVGFIVDTFNFTRWLATSAVDHTITIDTGVTSTIDALGVEGHNLFTAGASISIEGSSDNFAADTIVVLPAFTVTDNKPIYRPIVSAQKRYYRLKLTNMGAAPFISSLFLGQKMLFPVSHDSDFDQNRTKHPFKAVLNELNQVLEVHTGREQLDLSVGFSYLPESFINGALSTFLETHGEQGKPFFWVYDENKSIESTHYVTLISAVQKPLIIGYSHRNLQLQMQGLKSNG